MSFDKEHAIETYKSMINVGSEALKALQLLNGGAVVALLAYLGQVHGQACLARRTAWPLGLFVGGLLFGTVAFITTYFTQFALFNESVRGVQSTGWSHMSWLWLTVALALLSVVAFALGAFASVSVLTEPCPPG